MHVAVPRRLAAVLVAACAAAAALLPVLLIDGNQTQSGPRQPPWPLPPLTVVQVGGGPGSLEGLKGSPAVLLYVDRECVYCRAELNQWEALAPEHGFAERVWVVASPTSEMEGAQWVPEPLRARTLRDPDGSVGRTLGVNAVPAAFWVDATDTVRIVEIGQSSRRRLINNIQTITGDESGQ